MNDSQQIETIAQQWREQRPDIDSGPMALMGKLRRLTTRLRDEFVIGYEQFGIGEGEFDVLSALRRMGQPFELPPSLLADHTMVTAGATSKRIDRLVEAGLVDRRSGTEDRRARVIALTPEGHKLIDQAIEAHTANQRRLAATLSDEEFKWMEDTVSKWLVALDSTSDTKS